MNDNPLHHIIEALKVHIVGDDSPPKQLHPDAPRRRERTAISTHTVLLTAANPVLQLAAHEPNRCKVAIVSLDNPIVLCDSYGQANDVANQATGLPAPNGAVVPNGLRWPIETTDPMWIVGNTYPSRVSVVITSYADK